MLCLSNNCAVGGTLSTMLSRFDKLYKRRCGHLRGRHVSTGERLQLRACVLCSAGARA
jgi:hypothetical protein